MLPKEDDVAFNMVPFHLKHVNFDGSTHLIFATVYFQYISPMKSHDDGKFCWKFPSLKLPPFHETLRNWALEICKAW